MRRMNWLFTFVVFGLTYGFQVSAYSPAGLWTTIDDKTGNKRAIVRLEVKDNALSGTIVKVFSQPGDTGICSKCPGELQGKPIEGLTFLWNLKEKGDGIWENGEILDAKSGRIYRARLHVEGNKLFVRGYLGVSLLGRTQVWVRT